MCFSSSAQADTNRHACVRAHKHAHKLWKSTTLAISCRAINLRQQKSSRCAVPCAPRGRSVTLYQSAEEEGRATRQQFNTTQFSGPAHRDWGRNWRSIVTRAALVVSPFVLNKFNYLGCQSSRKIIHPGLSSQTHSIHFSFFFSLSLSLLFNVSLLSFSGLCEMRILNQPHSPFS